MKRFLLGIDYGREGALAVMEAGSDRSYASMRLVRVDDLYRGRADSPILPITDLRDVHVFVEDFMLRYARVAEREACIRYGILLGSLIHSGARYHRVRPQEWRETLGLPKVKDSATRKETSWSLARELWPHINFSRADLAEAALIAEHGRRTMETQT